MRDIFGAAASGIRGELKAKVEVESFGENTPFFGPDQQEARFVQRTFWSLLVFFDSGGLVADGFLVWNPNTSKPLAANQATREAD